MHDSSIIQFQRKHKNRAFLGELYFSIPDTRLFLFGGSSSILTFVLSPDSSCINFVNISFIGVATKFLSSSVAYGNCLNLKGKHSVSYIRNVGYSE